MTPQEARALVEQYYRQHPEKVAELMKVGGKRHVEWFKEMDARSLSFPEGRRYFNRWVKGKVPSKSHPIMYEGKPSGRMQESGYPPDAGLLPYLRKIEASNPSIITIGSCSGTPDKSYGGQHPGGNPYVDLQFKDWATKRYYDYRLRAAGFAVMNAPVEPFARGRIFTSKVSLPRKDVDVAQAQRFWTVVTDILSAPIPARQSSGFGLRY